jgi:hypothetical protein
MRSSDVLKYRTEAATQRKPSFSATAEGREAVRSSAEPRPVLFVAYNFPPNVDMGANTCAQIARYLPMYGWKPIVLTVEEDFIEEKYLGHGGGKIDEEFGSVVRAKMLPHPLDIYRRLKSFSLIGKLMQRNDPQAHPSDPASGSVTINSGIAARNTLLTLLSLPDIYTGWIIPAVLAGIRAAGQNEARVIFSSAPFFTVHLAACALSLLTGLPWVAHFRDPWVTGRLTGYFTSEQFIRISGALERMVLTRAQKVICVTEEHAELLRSAYPKLPPSKFVVVRNGFDGVEWDRAVASAAIPEDEAGRPEKFRITYAGKLYMKRSPVSVFRALRTLIDAGEIRREDAQVELIGWCESSDGHSVADLISEAGLEDCVEMAGLLSHSDTLRRLSQSNLQLLLAEELTTQIPGKTYEYLKTGRPILALTRAGAVATLLRQTGGSWVVDPDDQDGVTEAIRECYRTWKHGLPGRAPDASLVESFDRRKTTGQIADALNSIALK